MLLPSNDALATYFSLFQNHARDDKRAREEYIDAILEEKVGLQRYMSWTELNHIGILE